MWFRNLLVYRLTQDLQLDADSLEKALGEKPARPCASQELTTYGFTAPFGKGPDAPLVHVSQDFFLISARKEERILPGSVVRDALKEKVDEIEAQQMRKVYKKERDQLKDEIVQTLLPRAFIRRSSTFAAIAPSLGLILVDSASAKKAEDLLDAARSARLPAGTPAEREGRADRDPHRLGQDPGSRRRLPRARRMRAARHPRGWRRGPLQAPGPDQRGNPAASHRRQAGHPVVPGLVGQAVLRPRRQVGGQAPALRRPAAGAGGKDGGEDALGQLDASFTLMMLTFAEFLPALFEALGGEEIPQGV